MAAVLAAVSAADARVADLRLHETPIHSISPGDRDFSDLEPLRQAIGSRRIVMLGEESHGDGATFLAKTRLIQFLHERMGFDVLVFESGFYDVHRAWVDAREGTDPMTAIRSSIFDIWTDSAQMQALWHYIAEQSRTSRPIALAGIDSQFTGAASRQHFVADLNGMLNVLAPTPHLIEARQRVIGVLTAYSAIRGKGLAGLESFQKETTVADQARFYIAMETLQKALMEHSYGNPSDKANRDYWVQLLRSTSAQFEHLWHEDFEKEFADGADPKIDYATFNIRDRQMADNLIWLAGNEYAGRKIIVWAATSHEMRHRNFFLNEFTPYVPMGDWIDDVLGDGVYTIGFTAYRGRAGIGESRNIGVAAPGSIESLLHAAGPQFAFLDFRHLDEESEWLTAPLSARPLGYVAETTDWPAVLDGLFYIETMTPSTLISR